MQDRYNPYTVNDFFCGAGGFGLAFRYNGFTLKGAWDFDKYAVQSYAHNVDEKVEQADIKDMGAEDIPEADIWSFGFPCQNLSISGDRTGMLEGINASGLFYEIMRLLSETKQKPRLLIAENVKPVKHYFPVIEEEFQKQGYRMYYKLFNSKHYGVPQNRERYYIVGVRDDCDWYFKFSDAVFSPRVVLDDVLEDNIEDKFYLSEKAMAYMSRLRNGKPRWEHHTNKLGGLAATLTANMYKGVPYGVIRLSEDKARRLTPRECARLQGFPDAYEQVVSNTQFYKQMGNAVTVPVADSVAMMAYVHLRFDDMNRRASNE